MSSENLSLEDIQQHARSTSRFLNKLSVITEQRYCCNLRITSNIRTLKHTAAVKT